MIAAVPFMKGGRAFGRALPNALLIGLCVIGLAFVARGALVPAKAWIAQILLDRAFDQSLSQHRAIKPWFWADMAPVARISLPRLGVREIALSSGSGQAMAFGPTLMPVRNPHVSIMAAHRDTHFAFMKQARKGDVVEVQAVDGRTQRYRITGFQIMRWDRFAYPRDPARPVLALTTCYPLGVIGHGPLRLVAWAEAE
ncbi:sortase domain-bontaining protein [Sphingobium sp.]|uniref:sortase domain-containing protein n=1 Tax=Sphingobium sp. TaxID=1912891 RepID=UPI0028BDD26D|nr:sortase [Sphingobium sp.]